MAPRSSEPATITSRNPFKATGSRIEPLVGLIPEIMERNDQLRALWTAWRQNATPGLTPRQYFARGQIKVLCDFVEYLYFASDAFARSARGRW